MFLLAKVNMYLYILYPPVRIPGGVRPERVTGNDDATASQPSPTSPIPSLTHYHTCACGSMRSSSRMSTPSNDRFFTLRLSSSRLVK